MAGLQAFLVFRHIFMGARAQPQTQSKRYKLVNNCNRSECVPGFHPHVLGELMLPSCNPHVNLKGNTIIILISWVSSDKLKHLPKSHAS